MVIVQRKKVERMGEWVLGEFALAIRRKVYVHSTSARANENQRRWWFGNDLFET